MFRKHTILIFALKLISSILYYLEISNGLSLNLSITNNDKLSYTILICIVSIFILCLSKNRKRQISLIKIISVINVIYVIKTAFLSNSSVYGFIYLALVTLILTISLNSLKKDQELIDSVNRLR